MTKLRNYDSDALEYEYDAAGNVTKMTDYHGSVTNYTYDDVGRLSTLTAPGSKVWTYGYNAIGQPTGVTLPNGMHTAYSYDGRNRLTKIDHKVSQAGASAQSFTYGLDKAGNITKTTHGDGSFWEYEYDARYRLTKADRHNKTSPTITAAYAYTYDAGDNLITAVEPFEDDFNDGNMNGWTVPISGFSVSDGVLTKSSAVSVASIFVPNTDADLEATWKYRYNNTTDNDGRIWILLRALNGNIIVHIRPHSGMQLREDTHTVLDDNTSATSDEGVWYQCRAVADGENVTVWRGKVGEAMCQAPSLRSSAYESLWLKVWPPAWGRCGVSGGAERSETEPETPQRRANSAGVL